MAAKQPVQNSVTLRNNKRKLVDMEDTDNTTTAQSILEKALNDKQPEQPLAKKRQTKPLFRPWEYADNKKPQTTEFPKSISSNQILTNIPTNVVPYHANMVRQHPTKPRTEKDQQLRNRNNVACLINRRNKQAEQLMLQQQYFAYHQQQAAMMEQSIRSALYLRYLQQLEIQRQYQMFVFGQQY